MEDTIKAIKMYAEAVLEAVKDYEDGEYPPLNVLWDAHDYSEWTLKAVAKHTEFKTPAEVNHA